MIETNCHMKMFMRKSGIAPRPTHPPIPLGIRMVMCIRFLFDHRHSCNVMLMHV